MWMVECKPEAPDDCVAHLFRQKCVIDYFVIGEGVPLSRSLSTMPVYVLDASPQARERYEALIAKAIYETKPLTWNDSGEEYRARLARAALATILPKRRNK